MVRRVSFILPKLAVCFGGKHSMENTQGLRLNIWEICIGFILLYFLLLSSISTQLRQYRIILSADTASECGSC